MRRSRALVVAGLVLAAAAYLGGSSDPARSLREGMGRGVTMGPFGLWLDVHKNFLRVVIISLGGLAIVVVATPTPALVITVAVIAAVLIVIVEIVSRPRTGPAVSGVDDGVEQRA